MLRSLISFLQLFIFLPAIAFAQISEKERLSGFAEHQKWGAELNEEREGGEEAYLERLGQWELQREKDRLDYKARKEDRVMEEDGPEARADQKDKLKYEKELEQAREEYSTEKARQDKVVRGAGLPTEAEEYGLNIQRPRYDYKKRPYFGAPSPFGIEGGRSSGGGAASSGRGRNDSRRGGYIPPPPPAYESEPGYDGDSSFPPPPTFDDFGGDGDGDYIPGSDYEDYGDAPPPPPPPPFGDDYGGGDYQDFPPPPPPPPPPFGDEY